MIEKEQAIQIIREEYENGFSPTDIAQNLSKEMGVPFEPVYKFVMHTLSVEAENLQPSPTPPPQAAVEPIPPAVPQELAEYIPEAAPQELAESMPETALSEQLDPVALFLGGQAATAEGPAETDDSTAEPTQEAGLAGGNTPNLKALEQNPAVEKFILGLLAKNRQTSDTVLAVCERTGLDWNDAQRLVARIETKNQKTLRSKQNRLPLVLSIIALLAGALLLFGGISESYTIYSVVRQAPSAEEMVMTAASQEFLRRAFWALITGGALLIGGAVGLFISLRSQFE